MEDQEQSTAPIAEQKVEVQDQSNDISKFMDENGLIAGKYKNIDEVIKAVKHSAPVYEENQRLKQQYTVPENYNVPAGINVSESDVNELVGISKNAGLTQTQFEKVLSDAAEVNRKKIEQFESTKKSLGDVTINHLRDYVNQNYPEAIADKLLNEMIVNTTLRDAALKHREDILVGKTPTINSAYRESADKGYTMADMVNVMNKLDKDPRNESLIREKNSIRDELARKKFGG